MRWSRDRFGWWALASAWRRVQQSLASLSAPSVSALALLHAACGPSIPAARHASDPPVFTPREADARQRLAGQRCKGELGWLFPGVGQLCHRKDADAAALMSLGVAEAGVLGVGLAHDLRFEHPAVALPLVGLQNLWMRGLADVAIDRDLAAGLPYAPQDTLGELALAPFNPRVLSQPDVWAGILGASAVALLVSHAVFDRDLDPVRPREVNWFGHRLDPSLGYPVSGATLGATFLHVAIGEETLFRGMLQSRFSRRAGETGGWAAASALFAAVHIPNLFAFEAPDDRDRFLYAGLPMIAAAGSYIGLSYRWHDYSLAPPVAIHFWYNFLLSAASFLADPDDSVLAASIRLPID